MGGSLLDRLESELWLWLDKLYHQALMGWCMMYHMYPYSMYSTHTVATAETEPMVHVRNKRLFPHLIQFILIHLLL
jgi:hypothetical protein